MRLSFFLSLFFLSSLQMPVATAQNLQKGLLEQGFEYFFETGKYEKASRALDSLNTNYDLRSVKLDYALNCAVKSKQKEVAAVLLGEMYRDFNTEERALAHDVGAWLGDTTFQFSAFFGKKWSAVSKSLAIEQQKYEDNLKSDYYNTLLGFLNVDQFVRFNEVSPETFKQVDSINLDNFTQWLVESPKNNDVKSRLNNQTLVVLLRHIGPKRFAMLEGKGVFEALLSKEIISAEDFGLLYDYVHAKPRYFVEIDAFVEKNWAKSGIPNLSALKKVDDQRMRIGLLPLEYSAFCIHKKVEVPEELRYAEVVDLLVFKRK